MAILLFTDFGGSDVYVGQVEAVLERDAPSVRVIHLLHEAPPFNVRAAAHLLAALVQGLPRAHAYIGVVDPGVGTARRGVVVQADSTWFVGPDNGLFSVVFARASTRSVWAIVHHRANASASFHGRDVFAPVAAAIATGNFPNAQLKQVNELEVQFGAEDLAEVIYIDHYGNAFTGMRAQGMSHAERLVACGREIPHARVFGEATRGTVFWYENSSGLIEIAVNQGSAAAQLGLQIGSQLRWAC
jgi:S-adenosylmethionine hydrolase